MNQQKKQRIAVIGTGVSGLACLSQLSLRQDRFEYVAFEHKGYVGGLWHYEERIEKDEYGMPITSVYRDLRTNIPKQAMSLLPDFPFPSTTPTFPKHPDVLQYLQDFADHYDLLKYIQFFKHVVRVNPLVTDTGIQWEVDIEDVRCKENGVMKHIFDAVMVCTGAYATPRFLNVPGLDTFTGTLIHSHSYRMPESFANQRVLVVGGGASGMDIALHLDSIANKVFWSRSKFISQSLPAGIEQVPRVREVKAESVLFTDGREEKIDTIIMCTGYRDGQPFLSDNCRVIYMEAGMEPLYKHIVHCEYPTLSFIGLIRSSCIVMHVATQAAFALAVIDGTLKLPSVEEMKADIAADLEYRRSRGVDVHLRCHGLSVTQLEYHVCIAEMAGVPQLPAALQAICMTSSMHLLTDFLAYHKHRFEITDINSPTGFIDSVSDD